MSRTPCPEGIGLQPISAPLHSYDNLHFNLKFGGHGWIRTSEAEAPDLQSGGFNPSPTCPLKQKKPIDLIPIGSIKNPLVSILHIANQKIIIS